MYCIHIGRHNNIFTDIKFNTENIYVYIIGREFQR